MTADTVKKYGRSETFAYELAKKMKEIKKDAEAMCLSGQASTAGSVATARVSAGLSSMVAGNRIIAGSGTTATVPGYAAGQWGLVVDGTAASLTALTETHLTSALEAAWTDGGDPSVLLMGAFQKSRMATFAGANAYAGFYNPQSRAVEGAVVGSISAYISAYGEHRIVLSRYVSSKRVLCIDPEYVGLGMLDNFKFEPLAKTGDGTKGMIVAEITALAMNPDAHAQIINLTDA